MSEYATGACSGLREFEHLGGDVSSIDCLAGLYFENNKC